MYDPKTGEWKDEDLDVSKRLTGLLDKDNQYMQQARTEGLRQANRRGLANSTMAVTAVEDSRIRAALPIASQDSSQANQRYLQGRQQQGNEVLQERDLAGLRERQQTDIASQERMQGVDVTSREKIAGMDIEAARERLSAELGSRETLAAAERALQRELTGQTLSQQERLAIRDLDAAEQRLGMEISSRERIAGEDRAQREWLANFDRETQVALQGLDATTRQQMQSLDIASQERIANMNVAAAERNQAASLAASFEASYSNMIAAISQNTEIPAAERQKLMDHAARVRENNINMVEQMYSIDLEWGDSGTTSDAGSGGTGAGTNFPGYDPGNPQDLPIPDPNQSRKDRRASA